jgi:hypothetical protein
MNQRWFFWMLILLIAVPACKKKDIDIAPIVIPNDEAILEGKWKIISARTTGNATYLGATAPVTGYNTIPPEGYYELKRGNPNTYEYNIKTHLKVEVAGIKREMDYNDRDYGTWKTNDSRTYVTFYANQGTTHDIYYTRRDSSAVEFLELSMPMDTTLENVDFKGKVIVNLIREE